MKGLQEALRAKEEIHTRVERREISEEMMEKNTYELAHIKKGSEVYLKYYRAFYEMERIGSVTYLNLHSKYLKLDDEKGIIRGYL